MIDESLHHEANIKLHEIVSISKSPKGPWSKYHVVGIKEPRYDPVNLYYTKQSVMLNLNDLQQLTGKQDQATFLALRLSKTKNISQVERVVSLLGLNFFSAKIFASEANLLVESFKKFSRAISILCISAGSLFLISLLFLKTRSEEIEMRTLRYIGISDSTIRRLVLSDGILLSFVGTTLGIGIGFVASKIINRFFQSYFSRPETEFAIASTHLVKTTFLLGMGVGSLAAFIAFFCFFWQSAEKRERRF